MAGGCAVGSDLGSLAVYLHEGNKDLRQGYCIRVVEIGSADVLVQ